jgi:hypothetical protein
MVVRVGARSGRRRDRRWVVSLVRVCRWVALAGSLGFGWLGCENSPTTAPSALARMQATFEAHGCHAFGCHGDGTFRVEGRSWIEVDPAAPDRDHFRAWAVDQMTIQCADAGIERKRVDPGSPSTSYLIDALRGRDLCGGERMPVSGPYLDEGQITAIEDWISDGAPP